MTAMRRYIWLILSSTLASMSAADAAVPDTVRKALRDARVPEASVSIVVQEVGTRRPSLALHADTSRDALLQWVRARDPAKAGPRDASPRRP
jgi:D-alanyl-D-alanine carboxypeptidase